MPQLMPLFWMFSVVMFSCIVLFMSDLYFFVMKEDLMFGVELGSEGEMDWWW